MSKTKELYRSKIHTDSKSHEVIVIEEGGYKLKMTYECYNAVERFTGELFVGGKWEHFFSLLDLGVLPDTSNYVRSGDHRLVRTEELIKKGLDFFNKIK